MAGQVAETEEQINQQRADFDAIPSDRVFYSLKLWVDADGEGIEGAGFYDGPKLKTLGLSLDTVAMCSNAASLVHVAGKQAVGTAVELVDVGRLLNSIFGVGETDDSKDSNTEGSDSGRAASAS